MPKTGQDALIDALSANDVALVAGVYGDPCTPLLDALAKAGLKVEISVEEKTALAQALGASAIGKRSVVAIKQVGVNVASDPLITAATHGLGAGLLLIAGDDPGASKSQNEQDSRWYAKLAEIPVLTPFDPQNVSDAAVEGLELSEELGIPVMLQATGQLLEMAGDVKGSRTLGVPPTFARSRTWSRMILERHKHHFQEVWPRLTEHVEHSKLNRARRKGSGTDGVISCGYVSSLVAHENHLELGYAHPLPEQTLLDFLSGLQRVLVVEEIAPLVEEGVRALVGAHGLDTQVLGRLTGHLPRVGQLHARHIEGALALEPHGLHFDVQPELSGSLSEVPCGGFEMLYETLDTVIDEEYLVAGDVGCSILHGYFPPQVIDTAYGLGTPIATAAGMGLSGRKGIAVIGDTGFLHSGITSLLNAVEYGHNVLVIVLYNKISAMTPGQKAIKGMGKLKALIEACGPDAVDEVDMQEIGPSELGALLARRLDQEGVHVLIARGEPQKLDRGGML